MNDTARSLWLTVCCALGVFAFGARAHAAFVVQITRGQDVAIPIAIVPFAANAGAPAFDVAGVVSHDLGGSGRFKAMHRKDMIDLPHSGSQIVFDDWKRLNADYIVVGTLSRPAPGRVDVSFELYNILTQQRLLGYQIHTDDAGLRLAAHQISDQVFNAILGIRGAFATRIAYVLVQGKIPHQRFQLVVADADGEEPQVVMQSSEPLMSPAWSPHGKRLAYVSFEDRLPSIYVQTLKTGARQRVSATAGVNQAPAWSPHGARLAVTLSNHSGNLDVFVLNLATRALTRITHNPGIDTEPQWTPDGNSLYFTSDRDGGPQIFQISLAPGSRPRRITFQGSYNARPRLSPDGSHLAFVTRVGGDFRIATLELDLKGNGSMQVLTHGAFDESPSYAPNGAEIIYATHQRGRGVLALVSTDGRVQQTLVSPEGDVEEPVWGPYGSE